MNGVFTWRSANVYQWELLTAFLTYFNCLLGPFAGLRFRDVLQLSPMLWLYSGINFLLLFAHPKFQNEWSALITIIAFISWFLLGAGLVYATA